MPWDTLSTSWPRKRWHFAHKPHTLKPGSEPSDLGVESIVPSIPAIARTAVASVKRLLELSAGGCKLCSLRGWQR